MKSAGVSKNILVVEDDPATAMLVEHSLKEAGFQVRLVSTGAAALQQCRAQPPHLMILDVGLPDMEGYDVCRAVRKDSEVPILFLTARTAEWERITGLEIGGDDYLSKPFSPGELVARVRSILRRMQPGAGEELRRIVLGAAVVDLDGKEVRIGGEPVALTPREFKLLEALIAHSRRALSREQLLDLVWGDSIAVDARMVDVHMSHLRQKLRQAAVLLQSLQTVRGTGYKYVPPD